MMEEIKVISWKYFAQIVRKWSLRLERTITSTDARNAISRSNRTRVNCEDL
jgi:protein associated with RNAse G/E